MNTLNDYPTVTPTDFLSDSDLRVNTLINNMRVTHATMPQKRALYAHELMQAKNNAISKTETIVLTGKNNKPVYKSVAVPCNGQEFFIDWLNMTADISTIGQKYRRTHEDEEQYMTLCQSAAAEISTHLVRMLGKRYSITAQNQTGRNFYKYSFVIGENYGLVCIGGQRDSFLIMLNGTGCALAPTGWQTYVHQWITRKAIKGKITRIDLAHDDLNGDYLSVDAMDELETLGGFHCGGATPTVQHMGNWKHNDPYNKGRTLTIGNRSSGKYCRFYEKGKKEGDKESPWVRCEVEYKANDRVIPFDVLLNPSKYAMGSYPCFEGLFLFESSERIKTNRKTAQVQLIHAFDWIKNQTGKYMSFFRTFLSDAEILQMIKNDDDTAVPKRLHLCHQASILGYAA
ncbi:replication initiation factor domain-containing protein [Psychrobacter aquimaris]|uniref:replication initiation factor domain-containing protein n=1 Tax=Psychrobacter aquimaris TaxID=292733 RepID=UPI003FD20575